MNGQREPIHVAFDGTRKREATHSRWFLERWLSPERCGNPRRWHDELEKDLGPFPSRGEYEHVMTIEGPNGEFLQLTMPIVQWLVNNVRRAEVFNQQEKISALYRREEKTEQRFDSRMDGALEISTNFKEL